MKPQSLLDRKRLQINDKFKKEILTGLRGQNKTIPSKYLYDQRGSFIFEQICELDEYYLTRAEYEVLETQMNEIGEMFGPRCMLVDLGSGSGAKSRLLLDVMEDPCAYVPIDISPQQLVQAAEKIKMAYPELEVLPVAADYNSDFHLPASKRESVKTVFYFPGSTVGNFTPEETIIFFERIHHLCGPHGGMLIGFDLVKSKADLEAAYNDSRGVTAAFNLNLLERLKRELGVVIDVSAFEHKAIYNQQSRRIEMYLVSRVDQKAYIGEETIAFGENEMILTEYSYKYSCDEFSALAKKTGFHPKKFWTDQRKRFSVGYLAA